jgi:hypothetical protein
VPPEDTRALVSFNVLTAALAFKRICMLVPHHATHALLANTAWVARTVEPLVVGIVLLESRLILVRLFVRHV